MRAILAGGTGMTRQIPIGYRIENGKAVIDEKEAEIIRSVFRYYLEGMTLMGVSEKTGLCRNHGGITAILTKRSYLGDGFYPAIVDAEMFSKAAAEREHRKKKLNRTGLLKPRPERAVPAEFFFAEESEKTSAEESTPARRAELLYGRIRIMNTKENNHGKH